MHAGGTAEEEKQDPYAPSFSAPPPSVLALQRCIIIARRRNTRRQRPTCLLDSSYVGATYGPMICSTHRWSFPHDYCYALTLK